MYKSTYLCVRIHTPEEALAIKPEGTADMLLYLIDVYDLGQNSTCEKAMLQFILENYHKLNERVPGILPRWTKGMMAWVTYLNALVPCYDCDEDWVREHNLLIQANPSTWSLQDLVTSMDALAMRWHKAIEWDRKQLMKYLHCMWSCAKKWTMYLHPEMEYGIKEGNMFKIHPQIVMACFSRFFWFHKTLEMHDAYSRQPIQTVQNNFFQEEMRHFAINKFRDDLTKDVWEHIPYYGDREIGGHEQLGENPSTYSVLYKRRPVCILQNIQRSILYDEPNVVRDAFPNITRLKLIQMFFQNNYKVDFKKFFFCSEVNHCKHMKAVRESSVPVIVESFKKYSVVHKGLAYGHGSIEEVFPTWVKFAEKPHGLDISELERRVKPSTTNKRPQSTIYELPVH